VWPGELISTPHGAIHVRRAPGAGAIAEPMVLVHGLGGSSLNWTYLMAELGSGFSSVALDLPGFGWSAPPDDADLTLDGHARAIVDVIESLGVGPVHLVGNSLGGAVSTRVASQRADLVRTLTLVSPALPNFPPSRATLEISMVVLVPRLGPAVLARLWRLPAEERVRRTQQLCFGDFTRADPLLVSAAVEDLRAREGLTYAQWAFVQTLRSLVAAYFDRGPRALWRQAARVTCPVLVLVGGRDRLVDRRVARRALRVFPDVRAVFMPTAGHVAQVEYPRAVAGAIRDLVASHAVSGGLGNDLTPWDA
jgi:pimeloyl-ACP methyl ester carboxylesterase